MQGYFGPFRVRARRYSGEPMYKGGFRHRMVWRSMTSCIRPAIKRLTTGNWCQVPQTTTVLRWNPEEHRILKNIILSNWPDKQIFWWKNINILNWENARVGRTFLNFATFSLYILSDRREDRNQPQDECIIFKQAQEKTDNRRRSVTSIQWSWNGTFLTTQEWNIYGHNRILHSGGKATLSPPLLFDLHGVKWGSCLCEWARRPATHQVGTVDRGPWGPLELRLHSSCLQGGLLIACSSTNWFSARSEPEWQGVEGGISCFCIYNSVASCVYVCVPKSVYLEEKWMDMYLLIHVCCPMIFGKERKVQNSVFTVQQRSLESPINIRVFGF